MPDTYTRLAEQLDALVSEMQRLELWTSESPTPEALASTAPFCYDTLPLEQWLQWVFIPQLRQMIAVQAPLPGECAIAPMAELAFEKTAWDSSVLIEKLEAIDALFSASNAKRQ